MTHAVLSLRLRATPPTVPFEFSLMACQAAAIVGPPGSGKSRLLATILGWSHGAEDLEVDVMGRRAGSRPLEVRSAVTWCEGAGSLAGHLTVRENIRLLLALVPGQAPDGEAMLAAVRRSDLPDRAMELRGHALRPLQRLQVWFAIARLRQSTLVLLDDPVAALDAGELRELPALIADLRTDGGAVLLAVRDLGFALQFAPNVWHLKDGTLVRASSDSLATVDLRHLLDVDGTVDVHESRAERCSDRTI